MTKVRVTRHHNNLSRSREVGYLWNGGWNIYHTQSEIEAEIQNYILDHLIDADLDTVLNIRTDNRYILDIKVKLRKS